MVLGGVTITPGGSSTASAPRYTSQNSCPTPPPPPPSPPPQAGTGVGTTVIRGTDTLNAGDVLAAGQYIASPNLQYALVMQTDGNLVLYGPVDGLGFRPMWYSATGGTGADRAVMQTDGNLVVYAGTTPKWWSGTAGPNFFVRVQDDGNLVIYTSSSQAQWQSFTGGHLSPSYAGSDTLNTGGTLLVGQYLRSNDGRYALLLQSDGNLILYSPGYHVLWHTGTNGTAADRLIMQMDGNLVLYTVNTPRWWSGTGGPGFFLRMQSDGNLVVYNSASQAHWWSGTGGQI